MDDVELRTLILETARDTGIEGKNGADLAEDVLARLPPGRMEAVLVQVFSEYVQDTVDEALDFLKARLN